VRRTDETHLTCEVEIDSSTGTDAIVPEPILVLAIPLTTIRVTDSERVGGSRYLSVAGSANPSFMYVDLGQSPIGVLTWEIAYRMCRRVTSREVLLAVGAHSEIHVGESVIRVERSRDAPGRIRVILEGAARDLDFVAETAPFATGPDLLQMITSKGTALSQDYFVLRRGGSVSEGAYTIPELTPQEERDSPVKVVAVGIQGSSQLRRFRIHLLAECIPKVGESLSIGLVASDR